MTWGLRRSLVASTVALSCLFGFVTISSAAPDTKPLSLSKSTKHHGHKKIARRHAHQPKVAKAAAKPQATNDDGNDEAVAKSALPPQVAAARAELNAGDVSPKSDASTLTEADKAAGPNQPDGVPVATSDQLNDIDRDAPAEPASSAVQPAPTPGQISSAVRSTPMDQPSAPVSLQQASRPRSDAWDGASLIGKVFVGLGVMLTLASAARLIIA